MGLLVAELVTSHVTSDPLSLGMTCRWVLARVALPFLVIAAVRSWLTLNNLERERERMLHKWMQNRGMYNFFLQSSIMYSIFLNLFRWIDPNWPNIRSRMTPVANADHVNCCSRQNISARIAFKYRRTGWLCYKEEKEARTVTRWRRDRGGRREEMKREE